MSWNNQEFCFACGKETTVTEYIRSVGIGLPIQKHNGCKQCGTPYGVFKDHWIKKQEVQNETK